MLGHSRVGGPSDSEHTVRYVSALRSTDVIIYVQGLAGHLFHQKCLETCIEQEAERKRHSSTAAECPSCNASFELGVCRTCIPVKVSLTPVVHS